MKAWEIPGMPEILLEQLNYLDFCKEFISDLLNVSEDAVVWVPSGSGFFIDNDFLKFKTKRPVLFRIVSKYLVIHIGLNTMEHICIDISDPSCKEKALSYLKLKAGKWTKW